MNRLRGLSIIVPTYNEAENVTKLALRIVKAMVEADVPYEIIFIDDHSTDATRRKISSLSQAYSIITQVKKGKLGKGFSIYQGFTLAKYEHIAMLDADLQYPPEILPALYRKALDTGFAVANRKTYKSSPIRTFASRANALIIGKLFLGLQTDIQSGLKVFHREVFERIDTKLISAWAIDVPLIHTAYNLGYTPSHIDIDFHPRDGGESKVNLLKTSWEIAKGAIKTKLFHTRVHTYAATSTDTMLGSGFAYKRKRFTTHTALSHNKSALVTIVPWQQALLTIVSAILLFGVITNPLQTAIIFIAFLSTIYFLDVLFNLYVVLKSLHFPPEIQIENAEVSKLHSANLPIYTVLCPLYREAKVLPQFVEAMKRMDWPKEKLEILLLLEQDDQHTIDAAKAMKLPNYVKVVVVPHSEPKTKPKASNYGLAIAKGEFVVVYDAEDKPEPTQLKKAYLAFTTQNEKIVCLQAKLNYYNPHHNLLTRLFTAEYSLWFDVILPGLQSINTTIPLGGTSNHFRTAKLIELQGWDPFNVTEDCDLGARLFASGYKTAIIDSTTLEEANSDTKNWFRQRSRWIKGYIQTYLVQMRNPIQFIRDHGWHSLIFQLIVGMRISFMLINPILWAITISYFTLYWLVGPTIESLYPTVIFYMAVSSLVFGNFIYLYNYMIGCAKRGHWDLVKFTFFIPFYWLMMSASAAIAVYQLIFNPHYWEKTIHGLHLDKIETDEKNRLYRLNLNASLSSQYRRVRAFAETRIFGGGLLVASSFIGNFLNFVYNAFLGRHLRLEDFGEIILVSSILNMSSIPLGSYMKTITYRSAYLLGMHKRPVKQFWVYQRKIAFIISAILASIWYLSIPFLQDFFRASSQLPLLLFTPVLLIGLVASVDSGFLSGNLKFKILSIVLFVEPLSKLAITFLLIALNLGSWVVAAVPTSLLISFAVGWFLISRIPYPDINLNEIDIRHFPKRFMTGAILNKVSLVLYMNMDILLAKHFFSPTDAGLYSFVSLAGKMVHYSSNIFAQFINPLVAHAEGAGKNSSKTFNMLLIPIIISSVFSYLLIGVFGNFTVPLLFGNKTLPIIKYLPFYALSIAAFSIASSISAYQLARRKYIYPIINFAIMAGQILVVFLYHDSISQFITIMVISGISNLLCIVSTNLYLSIKSRYRKESEQAYPSKKLRILIYNWRDTKHKWRGGAEVYIHELAKRWVKNGHSVTLFCGNDRLQPRNELIDGVQVIRRGGTFLVYFWAFIYYQFVFKGSYDVIIDSENGIPFFTPLYAKEKVYLLIHHVHQEVFRKSLHPPLSWIGILLERRIMPLVYRNIEIVTVSPSSKMDILEHKLTTKDPHIIYNGVDLNLCTPGKKHKEPTVLYLGRLTSLKSISVLIHSAKQILEVIPKVRFIIAGDGPDLTNLTKLVKKLHLENNIQFIGKVTEEEKIRLYQEAWVFVNPSLIEGWGITTIEANACGTPVVASNVAGLRDAVHNPHSGFLVPYGDVNEFTNTTLNLLTHKKLRQTMSAEAISWAKIYDWEKSATIFETLIEPKYKTTSNSVESRPYDTVKLLAAALLNTLKIKSKSKQIDNITFPNKVGVYTFYKNLEKIGPKNSYAIGLYKDPHGQFVFAKMRSASTRDYHYLSLRNEINIYEILTRVRERIDSILPKKFLNIEMPNLLHVHEDSNHLIMFLKYHKGKPLVTSKDADKTDIFILCSEYLSYLENHMTQQDRQRVSQRSPIHLLYLLPFTSARTVMNHPTLLYSILQAWFYIVLNYKTVSTSWETSLVHRDLHFRNILIDGNKIAIIDLQQCVITEKLQEYVTILRYYWETNTEYATLHNSLMNSYVDVPTFTNRVRWLALHSAIHGLTDNSFPKDMKQRWKNFLNYTLQKNSFTKEISI